MKLRSLPKGVDGLRSAVNAELTDRCTGVEAFGMVQDLEVTVSMAPEPSVVTAAPAQMQVVATGRIPGVLHGWSPSRPRRPLDFSRIAGLGCECGCDFNRADGAFM